MAVPGWAKPDAGVMATSPATAPDTPPKSDGRPCLICSTIAHATAAAAVQTNVLTKATAVITLASRLEPALNPNQPTQSKEAPIIVMVRLCGGVASLPWPIRFPIMRQPTSPAIPALMWTTVPPAKSSAPQPHIRPLSSGALTRKSGPAQYHTMWAIGK